MPVATIVYFAIHFSLRRESAIVDLELAKAKEESARLEKILKRKEREVALLRARVAARREQKKRKQA